MPLRRTLLLLLAAAWATPSPAAKILSPPDKIVVRSPKLLVLGSESAGAAVEWRLEGPGKSAEGRAPVEAGRAFRFTLALSPGLNRLSIGGETRQIFLASDASAPPEGFRPTREHSGGVDKCETCHDKAFGLKADGYPGACLGCHVIESQDPSGDIQPDRDLHFKANVARCSRCHDPHAGTDPKLLRAEGRALCAECHDGVLAADGSHPAVDEGGCSACHDPHFSGLPNHLVESLPGVCHRCHDQGKPPKTGRLHPPLVERASCAGCHDPHGAGGALLTAKTPQLCTGCHPTVLQKGHGGELENCVGCHDPHGTVESGLVRTKLAERCAECHEGIGDGKTVHAALKEGCQACHDPHAANDRATAQASCEKCHDATKNPQMASLHGQLSLPPNSCSGCHPAHASSDQRLVRGKLHFPLTQGKCAVCHGRGQDQKLALDKDPRTCRVCHPFEQEVTRSGGKLHEPVGAGECLGCHGPHFGKGKGLLPASQTELCGKCHSDEAAAGAKQRHAAAETCTDCHGPHGGGSKFLATKAPELCLNCHDDPRKKGATLHAALDEGCTSCHDPHAGAGTAALRKPERELCLGCHDDPTTGQAVAHTAAARGCSGCHEPHASGQTHLLRASPGELCRGCHAQWELKDGRGLHPPAQDCTECHAAVGHGGDRPKFLAATAPELCLNCHDDPGKGPGEVHAALEEGCLTCHGPHTGFGRGKLRGDSPDAACLGCHEDHRTKDGAAAARPCWECHEPHTSTNAHFLRKTRTAAGPGAQARQTKGP